jgi:hypothetical protein
MRMGNSSHCDSRDGVLEDQLLLIIRVQDNRIFIEGTDAPCQLYPAQKINRDIHLFFTGSIKEGILNVLCRLVLHRRSLLILTNCRALLKFEKKRPGQHYFAI